MRTDLPDIIADLYKRVAELERRQQNARRTGTIVPGSVDTEKGVARVRLTNPQNGQPYDTAQIRWKTASVGAFKINIPPSDNQQVEVVSESGDLTDAIIDFSTHSNENPLPAAKSGECVITTGDTTFTITGSKVTIKTGTLEFEADLKLKGKFTHEGDYDQSGVHTDSNGVHA